MGKRAVTWLVVTVVAVAICVATNHFLYKRRPSTVPSAAVFLRDNGKDVWVACEVTARANLFLCSFYAPRTGELLSAMKYSLIQHSVPFPEKVKIVRHDGYESIGTTDGTLVAFHPVEF